MVNIIDYFMMVAVSITIFNIFSENEKWINFFFLVLIGVYFLLEDFTNRKKKPEKERRR